MSSISEKAAIEIQGVSRYYGHDPYRVTALENIFLSIRENEFFTLLGPSGCGKTTLLRLIAGFDFPSNGAILLNGEDIAPLPPFKRPVNTVFQSYALFPHMTVAENIGFGLKMLGKPRAEIGARVEEMLDLVHMVPMRDRQVSQISGGQQQRVALARALAPKPKVLLLDEPLSALDYKLRKEMQIELKRVQAETGITFVFVTHDQEEALTMSDRIAVMSSGSVRQVGTPREIYDRPADRFVADFIGESNFLAATVLNRNSATAEVETSNGAVIEAALPTKEMQSNDVTLVIRPEHAALTTAGSGTFDGVLTDAIYFGTDTHYHLTLDDGTPFIVREQNSRADRLVHDKGDRVGVRLGQAAAQILGG